MKKGKLLFTEPGGGRRVDVRPSKGNGWLVLEFEYDEAGQRKKVSEKKNVADGYVIELMRKDPEFWERFKRLADHPNLRLDPLAVHPQQLKLDV